MAVKIKLLGLILFIATSVFGQKADEIVGIWWNAEKDGRVEVYKKGNAYFGKIAYIKNNENPDGSTPKKDENNPNNSLQDKALMGAIILTDLEWDGSEWDSGEIYDAKSGNTYSCFAKMQKDGSLYFKGYIGLAFIGRSTTWTRYK